VRACEGSIGAGLKQVRTLCAWWQISASLTSSQSASFVDFATATKSLHTAQVPFVTPRIACNSKPTYVDARAASRLIGGYEYRWSSLKFLFLFLVFIQGKKVTQLAQYHLAGRQSGTTCASALGFKLGRSPHQYTCGHVDYFLWRFLILSLSMPADAVTTGVRSIANFESSCYECENDGKIEKSHVDRR